MVRDLDQAAENWKRLGFTVSPRGTHSAKMGSANYTIMLDPDYFELLGVLVETEHNAPARAFLEKREPNFTAEWIDLQYDAFKPYDVAKT